VGLEDQKSFEGAEASFEGAAAAFEGAVAEFSRAMRHSNTVNFSCCFFEKKQPF
jgi:hypothetical protein